MGQRRPGWVDPLHSLERPDDDWCTYSRRRSHDALASVPVALGPARTAPQPPTSGLYDARFEHDACGVALVADLKGRRSHTLVIRAVSALEHLAHRGATGSEEDSGDGAGILLQVPDEFYRQSVEFPLPGRGRYATGIAFLSRDPVGGGQGPGRGGAGGHRGGPPGPRVADAPG